jgi:anti-sigma factor RsiW
MKPWPLKPCPNDADLKAILRSGHWPAACDPELRSHIETCGRCSEQLLLLQAFQNSRSQAMQAARLDHPNLLWWRAQLRRRNEALERVARPITTAQIFALCVSLLATVALIGSMMQEGLNWSSWLPSWLPDSSSMAHFDALTFFNSVNSDWGMLLLLTGFGTVILLGAVVVYLASDRN